MSSGISSLTFYNSLREPIQRLQTQIDQTQQEISTGQRADIGLELGSGAATAIRLQNELGAAQATIDANKAVSVRLTATQSALGSLSSVGQSLQQQLVEAASSSATGEGLQETATATVAQIQSILNTNVAGGFLFGGINSAQEPIANYFASPASAAKNATDAAFKAAFGFAQNASGASAISGSAMQSFLDDQFAGLFSQSNWKTNWSVASDTAIQSRVGADTTIDTSVSANEAGVRELTQAAVMLSDIGLPSLGADAQKAVVAKATSLVQDGLAQVTQIQARVGLAQSETDNSSSGLATQTTYLQGRIDDLQSVDPAAASLRMTTLSTQLQSAYSLTSRISQLSLLKYI